MWTDVGRFKFNQKEAEIKAVTGEVLSTEQRSDTHVSGGGSTYSLGTAVQGSTSIRSTVVVTRNIRLKTQDGRQHDLQLEADFPLAQGDKLSVFIVNGGYYLVHNHTTGLEFAFPFIAWAKPINRWLQITTVAGGAVFVAILFFAVRYPANITTLVAILGTLALIAMCLGISAIFIRAVVASFAQRKRTRMFDSRFREAAKHILES